jgi:DNA-binding response OmpR family regulator
LARHKDTAIRKMDLLDLVYGPNASDPRLMDSLIKELRQALSPTHPGFYIKTVHAKGVMLSDPS